ncbi:MAG TPA: archease [Methylomirabilota bacterium]
MDLAAEGRTLPEAFSRIALALFAVVVDPASVGEAEVREVRAHADRPAGLLRRWLEECLYVHEVEGFACRSIEFAVFDPAPRAGGERLRLHAFLRGEPIDPHRHRTLGQIRGVSGDGLGVETTPGGFHVRARLEA